MTNPAQAELPQPTPMQEHLDLILDQDNGGVHLNSGIVNHAAYLVAVGGAHRLSKQVVPGGIGWTKLAALWYRVGTEKLMRQSEFGATAQFTQGAASSGEPLERGTGADGENFEDTSSACQTAFAANSAPWTLVAPTLLAARRRLQTRAFHTEKSS